MHAKFQLNMSTFSNHLLGARHLGYRRRKGSSWALRLPGVQVRKHAGWRVADQLMRAKPCVFENVSLLTSCKLGQVMLELIAGWP